jgi:FkbM family methyltransferase
MGYDEGKIIILGRQFSLAGARGDIYFEQLLGGIDPAERDVINIMAASISENDWALDVGANIGLMSLAISTLCPRGKIFAFEPAHISCRLLKQNVERNKILNIKIYKFGLSDSNNSALLTYNLSDKSGAFVNAGLIGNCQGLGSDNIKLRRLDDEYKKLGITKCSFIKVDVEGHEPNFLRGARQFIKKFKPQAVIEVNQWCLNVFSRMSLPDFIDLAYDNFSYIFAFHEGTYLDLSDENTRFNFYYENAVNNKFTNIYCGFDRKSMVCNLNLAFDGSNNTEYLLEERILKLEKDIYLLRNSRPQKTAEKINKMLRR